MSAITLLDVNVLIALCDARHMHHAIATTWFRHNAKNGWASCPLTQNGTIRIMSNPKYTNPRSMAQVLEQIGQLCGSQFHHFWDDSLALVDKSIFSHQHLLGHNQITDAYLLALALSNKGKFLTIDGKISLLSVVGAQKQHLEILA